MDNPNDMLAVLNEAEPIGDAVRIERDALQGKYDKLKADFKLSQSRAGKNQEEIMATLGREVEAVEKEKGRVEEEKRRAEEERDALQEERDALRGKLEKADGEAARARAELQKAREETGGVGRMVAEIGRKSKGVKEELRVLKGAMEKDMKKVGAYSDSLRSCRGASLTRSLRRKWAR
jgi:chromosome segregation ATPase